MSIKQARPGTLRLGQCIWLALAVVLSSLGFTLWIGPTTLAASAERQTVGAATAGVPSVDPDYSVDVRTWWARHPMNPASPSYQPTITSPTPGVNVQTQHGGNLQAAIDALPPEGGTLYLPSGVYEQAVMVGRSNVHFRGDGVGQTLLRGLEMWGCTPAVRYSQFNGGVHLRVPAAVACFQNPGRNIYFKDLTFDGAGRSMVYDDNMVHGTAVFMGAMRDVLFDEVSFQNYPDTSNWHVGLVSGNRGVDNVWCRGCRFVGPYRYAWFLDGAHGSGIVNSRVEGHFGSGGVLFLTNDDFTEDLDNSGTFEPQEIRNAQYNVVSGSRFEGGTGTIIQLTGFQNLVEANTVERTIGRLVTVTPRCSNRWYKRGFVYQHYDNVVAGNQVSDAYQLVHLEGNKGLQCGADTDPALAALYYGRVGKVVIENNRVMGRGRQPEVLTEAGPVDGPHLISGNCVNAACAAPAEPAPTVTPTPVACSPRPAVVVSTIPLQPGRFQVAISVGTSSLLPNNHLQSVRVGTVANAIVSVNGARLNPGATLDQPAGARALALVVDRTAPGQPSMVQLTVVDSCGAWATFVGGGPGSF